MSGPASFVYLGLLRLSGNVSRIVGWFDGVFCPDLSVDAVDVHLSAAGIVLPSSRALAMLA